MLTRQYTRRSLAFTCATAALLLAPTVGAAPIAPGYTVDSIATPDAAAGGVLSVGGAIFVGSGAFGAGTQSVVRIDAGGTTVLADGFNALGGFAYDAVNDRLIVGDNAGDLPGTLTGDTVYAITNPFGSPGSPAAATALELLPSGSVPGYADVLVDPNDPTGNTLLLSDASASFPPNGVLVELLAASGATSVLQPGLAFSAGLATDGTTLYVSEALLDFSGQISAVSLASPTDPLALVASLPGGVYDIDVAPDGTLLVSSGGSILRVDPTDGSTSVVASGLGFATGLFAGADGSILLLDGFPSAGEANLVWQLVPIPEPGSFLGVSFGLLVLAARRRTRNAS